MKEQINDHLRTIDLIIIMLKEGRNTTNKRDIIKQLESKRNELEDKLRELFKRGEIKFGKSIKQVENID